MKTKNPQTTLKNDANNGIGEVNQKNAKCFFVSYFFVCIIIKRIFFFVTCKQYSRKGEKLFILQKFYSMTKIAAAVATAAINPKKKYKIQLFDHHTSK